MRVECEKIIPDKNEVKETVQDEHDGFNNRWWKGIWDIFKTTTTVGL